MAQESSFDNNTLSPLYCSPGLNNSYFLRRLEMIIWNIRSILLKKNGYISNLQH
ncbi:hypothetical protein AM1_5815 [Acaryochloris marina MBIC11017]|uniref:Uncharacterized protein n=1 Tax=Acaryochloris marina (strain MBIC 11017) TaxID=329726 RepID=B0C0G5_ACAM1|nr:hypothetical protein AM1_5815 [Acaryochloris marina MBIC11017]